MRRCGQATPDCDGIVNGGTDLDQVLAFRPAGHDLARRLPACPASLIEATGACGIQDTSPGLRQAPYLFAAA